MKIMTLIGLILIGLGVVGLILGGITYASTKNVVEVGTVHLEVDQKEEVPLSPFFGAGAVVVGVILLLVGRMQNSLVSGCWGSFSSDL